MKTTLMNSTWLTPLWEGENEGAGGGAAPEPEVPAQEPAAEPEGEAPASQEAAAQETPPAKPQPPEKDWKDRRIDQLTARLREAQRAAGAPEVAPVQGEAESAEAFEARVEQEVAQRTTIAEFNKSCNDAAAAGRAAYGEAEFNGRVKELTQIVDRTDQNSIAAYNSFLAAAIETGEAPKLLHMLGGDLNEASRILSLSPVKMAIELTRLAAKTPEEISKVPKPPRPVGGNGTIGVQIDPTDAERSDQLSTAEWMKRREAQVAEARR